MSNGEEYDVYSKQPPWCSPPMTPTTVFGLRPAGVSHGLPLLPPT